MGGAQTPPFFMKGSGSPQVARNSEIHSKPRAISVCATWRVRTVTYGYFTAILKKFRQSGYSLFSKAFATMAKKQLTNRRKRIIFFLSRGEKSSLENSNVGKDLSREI
jgi:hypothetical protein